MGDTINQDFIDTVAGIRCDEQLLFFSGANGEVAYCVRDNQRAGYTATEYAEALAVVGCAADTLTLRHRPWEIEPDALSLPEWRKRVWKLLFAMPGNALPKPQTSQASADAGCTCNKPGSPKALAGEHAPWCPSGTNPKE